MRTLVLYTHHDRRHREQHRHRHRVRGPDTGQHVALIHGYRLFTYDRRGYGLASQPTTGYDYDFFASDLNVLLEHLELKEAVLVGFSTSTGEVARYLSSYGSGRVAKAAFLASTGREFTKHLPSATYIEIDGAPQRFLWSHADEVTSALLTFLRS